MDRDGSILIENARIIFRNFAGKEGQYNREGDRNFCLLLDMETARMMADDGWNIKALKSREEGEPNQPYIPVVVSYKGRPPKVVMVTSRGRTDLSEDEIEILDWAAILKIDMVFRPYHWTVGDRQGIKAYLKSFYVTIDEDELELKYADLDQLPSRSGKVDE